HQHPLGAGGARRRVRDPRRDRRGRQGPRDDDPGARGGSPGDRGRAHGRGPGALAPRACRGEEPRVMSFGTRLAEAMDARGPVCFGIDPHPGLLDGWGLSDDAEGLAAFADTVLEACGDVGAAIKPQSAFFERHGSRGVAVLVRLLADASAQGGLTILDVKRGDIGSTMSAYAEAYLMDGSPLAADAITVSPYLGPGALAPAFELAHR